MPLNSRQNRCLRASVGLSLLFVTACAIGQRKEQAEAAAAQFHQRFNAAEFHAIYLRCGGQLVKDFSEPDFVTYLQAVHRKLGDFQDAVPNGWRINGKPGRIFVWLAFKSRFREGTADEQFMFRREGNEIDLVGYTINSPTLVIK